MRTVLRVMVVVTMAATLLGGLFSGLARLGWHTDSLTQSWMMIHGPLMICGFLGTMICLERAVALRASIQASVLSSAQTGPASWRAASWRAASWRIAAWSMVVPALNAAGALALLATRDGVATKALIVLASAGLLLMQVLLLRIHPLRYMVVMTVGVVCWLVGNLLWLAGYPIFLTVHWWTAFLILTIVGERLELSRVRRLTPAIENALTIALALYLLGTAVTLVNLNVGIRLLGAGALLMAGWLLRYDIARRTIYSEGVSRYIAACLLLGYFWLGVGGTIGMWKGALYAGLEYSAFLHALLLGFVFSMIFGHAPIILPAVTGLRLTYTPLFYLPLAFLHITVVLRVATALGLRVAAQQWSGLLNVVTVLLFLGMVVVNLVQSNRASQQQSLYPTLSTRK